MPLIAQELVQIAVLQRMTSIPLCVEIVNVELGIKSRVLWVLGEHFISWIHPSLTQPPQFLQQTLDNSSWMQTNILAGGLKRLWSAHNNGPCAALWNRKQLVWRLTSVLRPLGGWSRRILNSRPAWTWIGQSKTLSQEEQAGLGGHLRHSPRGSSLVPRIQEEVEGENWHYAVYSVVFWLQHVPHPK